MFSPVVITYQAMVDAFVLFICPKDITGLSQKKKKKDITGKGLGFRWAKVPRAFCIRDGNDWCEGK